MRRGRRRPSEIEPVHRDRERPAGNIDHVAIRVSDIAALATNVVVGAYSGHFAAVWGVATLFVVAIALPVAAFQVTLGLPGTLIGALLFV